MLPHLLPLEEAAQKVGLDTKTLRTWAEQGKVIAGISPEGILMVAVKDGQVVMLENGQANGQATGNGEHEHEGDVFELNRRLAQIRREQFRHLEGSPITVEEAALKYKVPAPTIYRWVRRGFIRVLGYQGRQKLLNEGDMAYCAEIWKVRKPFRTHAPLLDKEGRPYLLKRPELAQLRRSE